MAPNIQRKNPQKPSSSATVEPTKAVQSNAVRFINTYNRIDRAIRDIFNLKPSINFSDAVRRSSTMSSVVRKYEDELIDYGRLRNAIVHRSSDKAIAEPHDDVVERFEQIERLISTPPKVMHVLGKRHIVAFDVLTKFEALLKEMFKTGYSNIPVYQEKKLIGVVNRKMILDAFGKCLMSSEDVDDLIKKPIIDALDIFSNTRHFEVASENTTIDQAMFMFQQNRKLSTVVITKNGDYQAEPIGIIVTADIIDMQTILDNY